MSATAQTAYSGLELDWTERATSLLRPWLAWIVSGWCVGVVLCSLRPILGWHTLRRLRRVGVSPVTDEVSATLRRVSERLGLHRAIRVLQSTLANVPIVVGYFRPVILLPVSLVTSIPAGQLEAILAHELAHVRRHDFLVNLLQTLVETVFFYHPAVWWLSSRLRAERENCCDDLVVATLGNRIEYGRALLAIEELRGRGTVLAVGAADGSLLARVRRIAGLGPDRVVSSPWPVLSFAFCFLGSVLAFSLFSFHGLAQAPGDAAESPLEAEQLNETGDDAHFTDEQRLELKDAAAHGDGWFFVDLDRGRLATPPFPVEIDRRRLPYFVVHPKEEDLNTWLMQNGIDLIVYSHAKPLGDGKGAMNHEIQIRSVRTKLGSLASGLQQQPDKSWAWTTRPQDVVTQFERKDETTHISGFVPDSSSGEVRPDSPVLHPFRTAENILGLFLLEQPQSLKGELSLRIVHVAGATTPLADVEFATGDFVSGKNGPAEPPGFASPMVAELPDGIRVEFVGLAPGSADAKDASVWWQPDGTRLGFAPKYGGASRSESESPYVNTVILVHGIKDTSDMMATSAISIKSREKDDSGATYVAHYGYTDVPNGQTTGTFDVGVATESRSPKRFLDLNGKRIPSPVDAPKDHIVEDITVEKVGRSTWGLRDVDGRMIPVDPSDNPTNPERSTQVTLQIPHRWRTIDLQINAIDKAGKSYHAELSVRLEPLSQYATENRIAKLFDVPFDHVDHFEYQFRLYRYWVTFENVSMEAGHNSVVNVKFGSVADRDSAKSSGLQTGALPSGQWPMWGGSPHRNHVAGGRMPTDWDLTTGRNVLWKTPLGTQTYSSSVVSGGKVFIGTNNGAELDPRRVKGQDLSCLLCLDEATGKLLWQYASEKLPTGREHDLPGIGLCSTACVVGDRLWIVTNRCEVLCLDTEGFRDGRNDGSIMSETNCTEIDADVVWKFDMFNTLGVRPLHQAVSSIVVVDGLVLLNTSNSPNESRDSVPATKAPNFLALDAGTGRIVWQDNSAGDSTIFGGSACGCSGTSPAVGTIGGVTQAIFAGRAGWLYGFDFADLKQGKTTLLWKFDCNPKASKYTKGGGSTRNTLVASPVVVGNYVFTATGRDPEEGEGAGDLWCIDATKRGDISSELVFNNSHLDGREPIPHKPLCACDPKQGDFTLPNPNSGAVWHYAGSDRDGDGKLSFEETFHRSIASPAIHDGLLFIADFSGLVHCIDARTGKILWVDDLLAASWSSCVIADGNVLISGENGNLTIYRVARTRQRVHSNDIPYFGASIHSTPSVANDTLFLATKDSLFAIREEIQRANPRTMLEPAFLLPGHYNMMDVRFSNNDTELVAISTYQHATVRKCDVVGRTLLSEINLASDKPGRPFAEGSFKLSSDGRRVVAATDEYVGIWDTSTGELLKKMPYPTKEGIYTCSIDKLDCTPDLSVIAGNWAMPGRLTLAYDAHVMIWDGASGELLQTVVDKNATTLQSIDLSADGKLLATTNGSGAKVWELNSGKLVRTFDNDNKGRTHSDPEVKGQYNNHVWSVQFSPDGRQLAVGDILGVRLWDVQSGEMGLLLDAPYRYGTGALVYSNDGQLLARTGTSSKANGVVPIWSTQTGEKLFELRRGHIAVRSPTTTNSLRLDYRSVRWRSPSFN